MKLSLYSVCMELCLAYTQYKLNLLDENFQYNLGRKVQNMSLYWVCAELCLTFIQYNLNLVQLLLSIGYSKCSSLHTQYKLN
jgi:hypothetical protein